MQFSTSTLLALLPFFIATNAAVSGSGKTTRYWDCCKSSCAWSGKAELRGSSQGVQTCNKSDQPLTDFNAVSGCQGGSAFQCSHESPWAVTEDLAYGYAAVHIAGGTEASWCCACYELTFTSGPVAGKKMVVQATNTGGDLGENHFDITMPGGGVGIFNGCTAQWGAPSSGWGAQYGGIADRSSCDSFPAALKEGCQWRFDWFKNADNPTMDFKQVSCPAALTKKTGCVRADDAAELPAPAPSPKPTVVKPSPAPSPKPTVVKPSPAPVPTTKSLIIAANPSPAAPVVPVVSDKPATAPVAPVVPAESVKPVEGSPAQPSSPVVAPIAIVPIASTSAPEAALPTSEAEEGSTPTSTAAAPAFPTSPAQVPEPTAEEEEEEAYCEL